MDGPASSSMPNSFVDLLNGSSVSLDDTPLPEFDPPQPTQPTVDEFDIEEEDDDDVEEVTATGATQHKRTANYTEVEDATLIKAWESVSLDAICDTDQTGKRYWQRIEDKFCKFMPRFANSTPRTYRSLQGRWDVIKSACCRWSGAMEQVRNFPPSGTTPVDYDALAQERYKAIKGFQKQIILAHTLLEATRKKREMKIEGARSCTQKRANDASR